MRAAVLGLLLLVAGPAHAARHELSFEWQGSFPASSTFDRSFDAWQLHGFGLRGGYAVLRDKHRLGLVIDAGWTRARREAEAWGYEEDYLEDQAPTGSVRGLHSTFVGDTFLLGAKADVDVGGVWFPYLHAQVGLLSATAELDSDADSDRNVNQLRDHALAPLGQFTAGFELMIPDQRLGWPVTAAIFFEAGYQLAGDLRFDDLGGPLDASGAVVRSGIGLRM